MNKAVRNAAGEYLGTEMGETAIRWGKPGQAMCVSEEKANALVATFGGEVVNRPRWNDRKGGWQ